MMMPSVLRQQKAIDSLVMQLAIVKSVFKAEKVTLFVLNRDLQDFLFGNKRSIDRVKHSRKINLGNSTFYGVYHREEDFLNPVF